MKQFFMNGDFGKESSQYPNDADVQYLIGDKKPHGLFDPGFYDVNQIVRQENNWYKPPKF